ncbi:MAG: 2-oxo acid dehydrogenase subunit E2, partial [Chloroflexi bacterium]|nr:2-oxo acid dehydrogenase subunit E2 [Chloroflexota bacterium]
MVRAILMPKPGQMTEECTIIAWHKTEGDPVARGDVLFEIETDKSVMEVEAFDEGVLLRRVVAEGETAPVNAVCAWVGASGEAIPEAPAEPMATPSAASLLPPAAPALVVTEAARVASPATRQAGASTREAVPTAAATPGSRLRISPRASRLAAEAGVDPRTVAGTGPEGRITERDVRAAIDAAAAGGGRAGRAPAGRAAAPAAGTAPAAGAAPAPAPIILAAEGEEEPRRMSRMRQVIAERLTASWTSTPHFTVTVAVDVSHLFSVRAERKAAGTDISVTDFILAATAQTLAEFPDVNARTDGTSVWRRPHVHLGVAVSVPGGLVVPVIRDADRLDITALHERAAALVAAARSGTLPPDDLTGSTFTVSNLGMFEVDEFSAIINPGEAAI